MPDDTPARADDFADEAANGTPADVKLEEEIKAPSAMLLLLEARALWEYGATLAASPWLTRAGRIEHGDGHPVFVFPGLAAGDATTVPLRWFLQMRGYTPYPWAQGLNRGPHDAVIEACRRRISEACDRHGTQASLIGWSLGGIYARELAKELPGLVRCVITLGSPFAGHPRATNAWRLFEWVSGLSIDEVAQRLDDLRRPPPVPTTSIYSRTDGVVAWQCCINAAAPHTENIEVHASHFGLGMNPLALYAIADRLAQDPANWQRFEASGARRWFYKTPAAV
jgi:pimeloyl-ACP methyl ester carboxylesterase